MKTTIFKISAFILLFALMGAGCEKDNEDGDNLVVKEFPALYLGYNLKPEETVIIRNQETFYKIFSKELVAQTSVLQNIDFSKYNVLAGENSFTKGIAKLEHKFKQTGNSYIYTLSVIYNDALPAGRFCFGIIVNKLPSEADVKFEVNRINE